MEKEFRPEVDLTALEKNDLAMLVSHPGFSVVQKIMRSCVDQLTVRLLQVESGRDEDILARHRDARVAGAVFELFVNIINREVNGLLEIKRQSDKPVDLAEDLDIGDFVTEDEEPLV